jgi:hypothetical protein
MKGGSYGEGSERHPLLVQLGQTLHMRLPIMPMQGLDQASICFARCCLTGVGPVESSTR